MEITSAFDPTFENATSLLLSSEIDNEINRKLHQHEIFRVKNRFRPIRKYRIVYQKNSG